MNYEMILSIGKNTTKDTDDIIIFNDGIKSTNFNNIKYIFIIILIVITIQKNEMRKSNTDLGAINLTPSPVYHPTLKLSPATERTLYPTLDLTSSPTKALTSQPTNSSTNSLTPPTNDPAYNVTETHAIGPFKPTYNPSNSLSSVTSFTARDAPAHNFIELNKNVYAFKRKAKHDQITNEEYVSMILNEIELNSPPILKRALTLTPLITPTIAYSSASTNLQWPTNALSTAGRITTSDAASQPDRSVIFLMENSTLAYCGANFNLTNLFQSKLSKQRNYKSTINTTTSNKYSNNKSNR